MASLTRSQVAAQVLRRVHASPTLTPTGSRTVAHRLFSSRAPTSAAVTTSPSAKSKETSPKPFLSTQPPTARPPDTRKAQLIRLYTSIIRTSPLILFFQHNNLTSEEWAAVRRELRKSLEEVAPLPSPDGSSTMDVSAATSFQVIRVRMFDVALKIVEFFNPEGKAVIDGQLAHDLSDTAYQTIRKVNPEDKPGYANIAPLLTGPVATLTLPIVSPAHLAAALKVLAPAPPHFPPPTRKKNPGYYDPIFQNAVAKLLLVGGRVEGKTFDVSGLQWVGGIEGGLEGLRAQLVHLLQSAGLGITSALEGASKSLWLSLESRRSHMEEEQKEKTPEEKTPEEKTETSA